MLSVAACGAHLVEFDLHVTGDDELVARHDPVVEIGGARAWLADHPLDEALPWLERNQVPTVIGVIQAARDAGLGLYADIKTLTFRSAERLAALLDQEGMAGRTILASVRSDIVARCAEVAPEVPRAVLFASTLEEPVQLASSVGAHYVHPCWERLPHPDHVLADGWLDRVRANGLGVICWHEERPEVIRGLFELGVDGICTDRPDLLTELAQE
ncbi:glycerophosphodiester phosphodiesterase [Pseudofrankia sp. BMG5.36]|uniref:glycerophosphodiester phosphodiesterase n=1 Tax=Pseudofrankia sp. BMG5.36 TaxID=1834512 RepID=UPI0012FFD1CC|nr:glycerophosphodiester phosphodiesterase [Pseudofrankia sp. BMG5.36]